MNNDLAIKLKAELVKSLIKNPTTLNEPYLIRADKTYSRKELAVEIENETEFGVKILSDMLKLALDLMTRNKQS